MGMHPETNLPWTEAQIQALAAQIAADEWADKRRTYVCASCKNL